MVAVSPVLKENHETTPQISRLKLVHSGMDWVYAKKQNWKLSVLQGFISNCNFSGPYSVSWVYENVF